MKVSKTSFDKFNEEPLPTSISNGEKNSPFKEKKSKKEVRSSTSSAHPANFLRDNFFFPFPMLELLSNQSQKYVGKQIINRVIKIGLDLNDSDVFNNINFQNILRPFRKLNRFLSLTPRVNQAILLLESMLYVPFTISDIKEGYDYANYREEKTHAKFIRKIAKHLINCKLLDYVSLVSGIYGIPKSKTFYTTYLYYSPILIRKDNLENDEFIQDILRHKCNHAKIGRFKSDELIDKNNMELKTCSDCQKILVNVRDIRTYNGINYCLDCSVNH